MSEPKSKATSFVILDRPLKYLKMASAVLDVSISQILNDLVEYVSENVDEKKIWDDWKEKHDDFEDRMEEAKEEAETVEDDKKEED